MPRVTGLLETALYVKDVHRAAEFYRRLFGFGILLESDRLIALDVAGKNVLLLFAAGATTEPVTLPGGTIPAHGSLGPTHFAFSAEADELPGWIDRLGDSGIAVEGEMSWDGGARSIYFRDPDDNLVELITPGFWRIY